MTSGRRRETKSVTAGKSETYRAIGVAKPFMRNLKLITSSILLLLAGIVPVAAQSQPVAVAPMQFRGLMPVIEVKLNGQGPFAFMIDTGAGMQADIDTSVAVRLKLRSNGRAING